jgi:PleD family two-component response regulator
MTSKNDKWIKALGIKREKIPVLIIGNNPIEMTQVFNLLVSNSSKNYIAEVCFNIKDSFNSISKQRPEVILIDDNLPGAEIDKLVKVLKKNARNRDIRVIVLKSTNLNYDVIDNVDDYMLKDTISSSLLDRLIDRNVHRLEPQYA